MLNEDFFKQFPDERACRAHLRQSREDEGIFCNKCGGIFHFWMENQGKWQCYDCKSRKSLRSGTMMQGSKLSLHTWYKCMHYMISDPVITFSGLQMMRNLNSNVYSAVWYMMHKIRVSMGTRDSRYKIHGTAEVDDAYFEAVMHHNSKDEEGNYVKLDRNEEKYIIPDKKRGRGAVDKCPVIVIVESWPTKNTNPNKKDRQMGFVKMIAMENLQEVNTKPVLVQALASDCRVISDKHPANNVLKKIVAEHFPVIVKPKDAMKKLPWVHTIIANAKSKFLGTYHSMNVKYLQNYLNEFVYKLNRNDFIREPFIGLFKVALAGSWNE
jgi:hypothetical protein